MQTTESTLTTEELLTEFTDMYRGVRNQSAPRDTEAIIVLTANNPSQEETENFSRVKHTAMVLDELGKEIPVFYSGCTEESGYGPELMKKLGIPKDLVRFQNCGPRGVANTKTQFEEILKDHRTRNLRSLVLVTSSYHIPRVQRTGGMVLPKTTSFVVLADMRDFTIFNTFLKVSGEIERILKYSAKRDILATPR